MNAETKKKLRLALNSRFGEIHREVHHRVVDAPDHGEPLQLQLGHDIVDDKLEEIVDAVSVHYHAVFLQ